MSAISDTNKIAFQDWEKTSLILDILIDCEEYTKFDEVYKTGHEHYFDKGKNLVAIFNEINKEEEKSIEKKAEEVISKWKGHSQNPAEVILGSKFLRRILKEKEDYINVGKLYKVITEELIKRMPIVAEDDNLIRIVFLNEISACSEKNLAIGYADMALEELRIICENKQQRPYELYALYNKGLALLHDHSNTEGAIDTFLQTVEPFQPRDGKSGIDRFKKSYGKDEGLYLIYFWLIYVPAMCLLAEAYDDVYSSFKLQETIKEALDSIKNNVKKFWSVGNAKGLPRSIINYKKSRLFIQFIFSLINSHNFDLPNNKGQETINNESLHWLSSFKIKASESTLQLDGDEFDEFKRICESTPAIKKRIKSAEALYWLECAKENTSVNVINALSKSLSICLKYYNNRKKGMKQLFGSDLSDFANIFLECYIFYLNKQIHTPDEDLDQTLKNQIKDFYDGIFKKIVEKKWFARRREIVEKFLDCQDKLLRDSKKRGNNDVGFIAKILDYQIRLITIILDPDSERRLLKRFPDCEKEKLVKTLKETMNNLKINNIPEWIKTNNIKDSENFEEALKDVKYNVPESHDLSEVSNFIKESMNCDFYTKKLFINTEEFNDHLIYKSCRPTLKDCYGLTVLRRWQSFTPALSMGSEVGHKGGGYFVYRTNHKGEIDEGLVIDPGFDFLENFFDEGFSIRDITAILITHSHPDHASDFMSIVTLMHEMNKCGKRVFRDKWTERKLLLFITEGCHRNFSVQIYSCRDEFRDIIRVMKDKEYEVPFLNYFKVKVTKANHHDQTDHDSVGYIIKIKEDSKPLIGFTGDTQWYQEIEANYKECPVICMNLGGVVDMFKEDKIMLSDLCSAINGNRNIKKVLLRENHLYLPGLYLTAMGLKKENQEQKLLILSELCEEMEGGLRTDLAEKMSAKLDIPVLPEDIGLTVILRPEKGSKYKVGDVVCKVCNFPKSPKDKNIVPVETDKDNAIVYLCKEHYNQLKEGYVLPKINELELDVNELRKPLIR